jgi:hypothetical protein
LLDRSVKLPKRTLSDDELKQLEISYTYHSPKGDQPERYVEIREAAKNLAKTILECAPPSRERSVALTQIELGVTMANKAIACNE